MELKSNFCVNVDMVRRQAIRINLVTIHVFPFPQIFNVIYKILTETKTLCLLCPRWITCWG